jgi:hypothetical protein
MSSKLDIGEEPAGLSFQEKSLWVTMITTAVVYAYYFVRVLQIGNGEPARLGALFALTVIVMIVVQIAAHVVLAVRRKPEPTDERDRIIALVATRNSYYVLTVGIWCALGVGALSLGAFWLANATLLAFVIAELVGCGTQLVHYHRGLRLS